MPIAPRPNNKAGKIVKKLLKVKTKGEMAGNPKQMGKPGIPPFTDPIGLGGGRQND